VTAPAAGAAPRDELITRISVAVNDVFDARGAVVQATKELASVAAPNVRRIMLFTKITIASMVAGEVGKQQYKKCYVLIRADRGRA
jgi:hypothetical protein